jgi:hypothetical protein
LREIEPETLARLVGWSTTLKDLTPFPRCSQCGKKAAKVAAVAKPKPRAFRTIHASEVRPPREQAAHLYLGQAT